MANEDVTKMLEDLLGPPPTDASGMAPSHIMETVALRFLARVIHADETIHTREVSMLIDIAMSLDMNGSEARRILDDELTRKSDVAVLAAQIPDPQRVRELYAMGCLMGLQDGDIGDSERRVLSEFARGGQLAADAAQGILDEVLKAAASVKQA